LTIVAKLIGDTSMARYQVPPDPRDPNNKKRARRFRSDNQEPIPWVWLGLGVVVTIIGLGIAYGIITAALSREPLPVAPIEPTIIVLTAPPSPMPTATRDLPTPTVLPTATAVATPDYDSVPEEITVDFYAEVANTDGVGVRVRGGPSTNNAQVVVAPEGAVVLVLDGPEEANDFLWWHIQMDDGTDGWVVADYLVPAARPRN
jgi:hypothetical protein